MPVRCELINGKWRIVDSDGKIERTDDGNPRDGGGHDNEEDCRAQQRAINRNEASDPNGITVQTVGILADSLKNAIRTLRIARPKFYTPLVGGEAVFQESPDGIYAELWAEIRWTEKALEYIRNEEFRYISPEFDLEFTDEGTGNIIGAALLAIGLTNRPFLKGMAPVEIPPEGEDTSRIQVFMTGTWHHPWYGRIDITEQHLKEMVDNFDTVLSSANPESGGNATEMMVDYNHGSLYPDPESAKAAGWVTGRGIYITRPVKSNDRGGSFMDEQKIRAILNLPDDTEITDEHRTQAFNALLAQVEERDGQIQTLNDRVAALEANDPPPADPPSGTVQLTAEEHATLVENSEQGAEAAKKLREMEIANALEAAGREGKNVAKSEEKLRRLAEVDMDIFTQALADLPVTVDMQVRGGNGRIDKDATVEEVKAWIDAKTAEGVDYIAAVKLAEKHFAPEDFEAWRYRSQTAA